MTPSLISNHYERGYLIYKLLKLPNFKKKNKDMKKNIAIYGAPKILTLSSFSLTEIPKTICINNRYQKSSVSVMKRNYETS